MIDLKYKSWKEMPISVWKEIAALDTEDITRLNIEILAILCDVRVNDIYNLPAIEISRLLPKIKFTENFEYDKEWKAKSVVLNGKKYDLTTDFTKFTVAQYIDFQSFYGQKDRDLARIISCFLIPHGYKYNDGYDVVEVIEAIETHMSVADANSIVFFFMKESMSLVKATLICLEYLTKKRMKRTKKNKDILKQNIKMMEEMRRVILNG